MINQCGVTLVFTAKKNCIPRSPGILQKTESAELHALTCF